MNTSFIRALAAAGMIIALAGCAGAGAATTSPTSTPTVAPAPTVVSTAQPTALPSVAPSPAPSLSALDGTATFAFVTVDESKWKARCSPGRGVIKVADGRVAGEYVNLICLEEDDEDAADDLWDFWGRWGAWNDGGTWDGQFIGTREDASADHIVDVTSAGSGDYAGLRLTTHEFAGRDDSVWDISNTIGSGPSPDPISTPPEGQEQGDPQVTGTRSCGNVIVAPSETRAGDVTRHRGEVDTCTWDVADPRFAGPDVTIINADVSEDGSVVGWGSVTTRFGVGPYALERGADGTTTVRTMLSGEGRYKGFVYRDVQTGTGDTWTVTGWISPAE